MKVRIAWRGVIQIAAVALLHATPLPVGAHPAAANTHELIVARDGSGQFTSVQAAVDAIPLGSAERFILRIKPGVYKERIVVPSGQARITFRGVSPAATARTVLTFDRSAHQIAPDGKPYGTARTPSIQIDGNDFVAENVTFENSAGHGAKVEQAVAILINGDRCVFRHCRFLGWQDTLCPLRHRQYFADCYIEGHVDFIFGFSTAVFDRCRVQSKGPGFVAAQARLSANETTGYLFRDCNLTAAAGVPDRSVYLGRPWRPYSRVIFLNCKLGKHIRPEGWNNWENPANEQTAFFAEYGSSGPGANSSGRVIWARRLSRTDLERLDAVHFLQGGDHWNPTEVTGN